MPIYPVLSLIATGAVIAVERRLRTGIFRDRTYWITLAICGGFMIPVDGWLTKLSAPVVIYRRSDISGLRPIWDIPAEEFLYAFALLTAVLIVWEWLGVRECNGAGSDTAPREVDA